MLGMLCMYGRDGDGECANGINHGGSTVQDHDVNDVTMVDMNSRIRWKRLCSD